MRYFEKKSWIMDADKLLYEITVKDNEAAFKVLFEEYYPILCLFCKRFIQDMETREDIVQGVFASIWEQRRMLKVTSSIRNYLITSARNACVNYLQRSSRLQSTDFSYVENIPIYARTAGDDLLSLNELEQLLDHALSKLPEEYRLVYEMSRVEKRRNADVAHHLGVSEKTVERRKKSIEMFLRKELKDFLPLLTL
ncbi:MAG: RNA polymerase sigma-70 factor [Marinilabiliaceae bacterium]|nr:RNA polymerase sigma-70 factor [Marinilabiliaceae bacterium]